MSEYQATFMAQVRLMLEQLANPPGVSRSTPGGGAPRPCVASNPDDVPLYRAVNDLHVGVISTDLGTPGSMIPGCDDSDRGDDGLLNPIRNGHALQTHLPCAPRRPNAVAASAGFRPSFCSNDITQFPSFITYCSNAADPSCDVEGRNASTRHRPERRLITA